ncbi:hypothetical protein P6U16_01360 [Rhizobium sp. 32-5/1]|uniref:hypothetical protein n=1 Tax=Rhizobium sp. 32-5/1 TaxID=3019602 RepID=UPI00240D4395|nr:hypothetical protein [Rhizobium sp. 32-5/1]WEZ83534.1 hypothetical protein P6U16_01360 [Rhizobium sp. 32-5/1]
MNRTKHSIGAAILPALSRRIFLGGMAASAIPAASLAAENKAPSIDDFLAKAMPSEKARYHANALADAMAEMHPDHFWRAEINHAHHFALIVGDAKKRHAPVARIYVDDGSPLLADDVTGTTAFADWEASR